MLNKGGRNLKKTIILIIILLFTGSIFAEEKKADTAKKIKKSLMDSNMPQVYPLRLMEIQIWLLRLMHGTWE
jgi:hypothetical protein